MYGLSSHKSLSKKNTGYDKQTDIQKNINDTNIVKYPTEKDSIELILQQQNKIMSEIESINNKLTEILKCLPKPKLKDNEFVPFYVKKEFTCCDNKTELKDNSICMIVELLGNMGTKIFPFGEKISLLKFSEQDINLKYKDNEMLDQDDMYGKLIKENDLYVIEITDIKLDNVKISINELKFPVTVWCNVQLQLE